MQTITSSPNQNSNGYTKKWITKYADGYIARHARKELEDVLIVEEKPKTGKQLDYILVSARRKSCVLQCRPKWGPSMHRNKHGQRDDHALVECSWKWRLRKVKTRPTRDFSVLYADKCTDVAGNTTPNTTLTEFDKAMSAKLPLTILLDVVIKIDQVILPECPLITSCRHQDLAGRCWVGLCGNVDHVGPSVG